MTPEVAESGIVQYRAIDLHNTGDDIADSITMYLSETLSVGSSLSCGLDATMQSIINDNMPPSCRGNDYVWERSTIKGNTLTYDYRQRMGLDVIIPALLYLRNRDNEVLQNEQ